MLTSFNFLLPSCLWWKHKLAALCCPGAVLAAVNLPVDRHRETERKRDLTVIMSLCVFWTNKSSLRVPLLGLRGYASCCWVLHNIWWELRHGQHSLQLRAESLDNNVDNSCLEGSEPKHEKILMVWSGFASYRSYAGLMFLACIFFIAI